MKNSIIHLMVVLPFLIFTSSCEKSQETQEPTVSVQSISVIPSTVNLYLDETYKANAEVFPDNATDKTITWNSLNPSIAKVSDTGLITAMSEGCATIVASAGDKWSDCTVYVKRKIIAVTSITLDKSTLEFYKGDSQTLVAMVFPSDATHKTVFWSSKNSNVASVEQDGKVTAVRDGETVIIATIDSCSASCNVHVLVQKPQAVDLGLSVMWASFDLGASSKLDEGNRYSWGESSPKDSHTWNTYLWCNGTDDSLTKYCDNAFYGYNGFTDSLTRLEKSDDAASVILGETWRMPSSLEIGELIDNCTYEWIKESDTKKYVRLTSKINGQSICFRCPVTNYDKYLSSELRTNYFGSRYSYSLCVYKGGNLFVSDAGREEGNYIRPVCNL